MLRAWPVLFFIIPLIEIYLLIRVGEEIGVGMTILVVIITATIGVSLLRQQGLKTLLRANQRMQMGEMPAREMFDGFMLAAAAIMLITPGFFTDTIGFLLLIPAVRLVLMRYLIANSVVTTQSYSAHYTAGSDPHKVDEQHGKHTIDGDFKRED
jgi:UPF0716 protein FxsA